MEAHFDTEAKVTRAPSALLPRNLETQFYFYAPVKRSFSKTLFKPEGFVNVAFRLRVNRSKHPETEFFKNDDVTIVM